MDATGTYENTCPHCGENCLDVAVDDQGECMVVFAHPADAGPVKGIIVRRCSNCLHEVLTPAGLRIDGKTLSGIIELYPSEPPNEFRQSGDYWCITFEGVTRHVPTSRGLEHLYALMRASPKPVHVLELMRLGSRATSRRVEGNHDPEELHGLSAPASDVAADADEMARQRYIERLLEIGQELDSTDGQDRIDALQQESERLLKQVKRLKRRGKASEQTDLARQAVGQALKLALKKMRHQHGALHFHLKHSLMDPFGTAPWYLPRWGDPKWLW